MAASRGVSLKKNGNLYVRHHHKLWELAGAFWRVENINPILAMRVLEKNGGWGDFWQWRENQKLAASPPNWIAHLRES